MNGDTNHHVKRVFVMAVVAGLLKTCPTKAQTLDFSLFDSYGRKVTSQDYQGVPIFLEFGACW